jgi:DNA repair protein RecO (recombination protein O)
MKWTDEGIVTAITPFSEDQARLSLLTQTNGRQSGLFRLSKRQSVLQLGDFVSATWNARLSEHLGRFQIERFDSFAPRLFHDAWRLWLLQNSCGLMATLPDRHPYPIIFEELLSFIRELTTATDHVAFMHMTMFEKLILAELGFGIDLSECCVTQTREDLKFISPKTGRAVSAEAATPYIDKLLPLPSFWLNNDLSKQNPTWLEISNALHATHYFWQKWLFTEKQTFPSVRMSIVGYCHKKQSGLLKHP